ncbi:MAG: alpha/beta hydrolase [Faecalibacterium sp.]|nr:alpha/beta hydrolase [Faecalibacterium sp.]
MKMIHMECPGYPDASLEGYLLDCELTLGQAAARPAVVVCPGGGYVYCSPREGEPVALSYAAQGFHAFVLRYSTGWEAAGFAPLQQVSWAIGLLRQNAEAWHIDPDKIVTCGFSAGGHLAFAAGVLAEHKPNAMILGYPVVTAPNIPGQDFMLKLLTGSQQVTDEDAAKLNLPAQVTAETPPVFMAATAEDLLTGFGALAVANTYTKLGKPYELHVFQHGPHGYSLATEASADGSSQMLNPAFAHWQPLSVQWLHKVFGAPQFVDKSTSKMMGYLQKLGLMPEMKAPGGEYA